MGELIKMKIFGYKYGTFQGSHDGEFTLQVNPATIKFGKSIAMAMDYTIIGRAYVGYEYANHKEISFSFETLLDATGVISTVDIPAQIDALEKVVYDLNSETHRPNFLKVSWGSFIFRGVLNTINYDHTLFSPNGLPLRVKITFTLNGFMDKQEAAKKENKQSPDLSRIITIKAGESIPYWCNEIYGDASYCVDIANYNKLSNFRNIKPGTQLMFPALTR